MQQVIFNHYVIELGKYLFITQGFFYSVILSRRENEVTLPHSAQRKNAFLGEIKEMSKPKKLPSRKENCFRSVTSKIRSQIDHVVVGWGY